MHIVPIFSGGGTRLSAHIGILNALETLGVECPHIVGISGGSVVTALYCAGHSLEDMMKLAVETDFSQFKGYSLIRLLREGGLSSGDGFENWMDKQLNGITFAALQKDLSIVATDVNGGGPVIFNKQICPDMKVSEAVRYSMSIPLIFTFKPYKEHLLVDGAILSEDALFRNWTDQEAQNVCFRLRGHQVAVKSKKKLFFNLPEYLFMLIKTFMTALSREYVHEDYWQNTIIIDTQDMTSVDFGLSPAQKHKLYRIGRDTALNILPQKLKFNPSLVSTAPSH